MTIPRIDLTRPVDQADILALYPKAFPDEDLLDLVQGLLGLPQTLSLGAWLGARLAGHVLFTPVGPEDAPDHLVLLGPLAVDPASQRQGLGSALVRGGLSRARHAGTRRCMVLGDPNYYGRLGFRTETQVQTPYPLPQGWQSAWQSVALCDGPVGDGIHLPAPWRVRSLWVE